MRGEAALGSQLTKILDSWADVGFSQAAEEAKIEGKKAGLKAALGQVDAPELRGDSTIYGQAYDEGALLAHQSAVGIDIKETMSRLGREYSHDPQNFKRATEKYRDGMLESISPDLQVWANESINTSASRIGIEVDNNFLNRKAEQESAVIDKRLKDLLQETLVAASAGSDEEHDDKQMEFQLLLKRSVELGYKKPAEAIKAFDAMIDEGRFYAAKGEYTRLLKNEGIDQAEDVWVDFIENPPKDISPKLRDKISNEMESQLRDSIWAKERSEAAIEKRVKAGHTAYFEKLLLSEARGGLTLVNIQAALHNRTIDAQQYQALKGLIESDITEQESRRNTQVIGSLWSDIYSGVDEERESEIRETITNLLGDGIDAGTARSMLNVISSPDYQAVTKEPGFGYALTQINTSLGRASGPMAILDPNTADTVAAARRELYDRVSKGENAMDIVGGIIERAKMFNDKYEAERFMIAPQYSKSDAEGNFDLSASSTSLLNDWKSGLITLDEYDTHFKQLMDYRRFKLNQTTGFKVIEEEGQDQ